MLQIMPFSLAHLFFGARRFVVVAAQVQQAVDNIERQFGLHIVAALGGLLLRNLNADDQLAFQLLGVGGAIRKRQHIGRLVGVEILLVEAMDGGIVYKSKADLVILDVFAFEDGTGDFAQSAL